MSSPFPMPPNEPTQEMIEAGLATFRQFMQHDMMLGDYSMPHRQRIVCEIYRAMIRVAPESS